MEPSRDAYPDTLPAVPATLRWGGRRFGVTFDYPGRFAALAERARGRHFEPNKLLIEKKLPPLNLYRRDVATGLARMAPHPGGQLGGERIDSDLAARVAATGWYHTIELPGGIVTPGVYDHRPLVPHLGIPSDLRGMRVLDVATFDGFWAFEFERRGAEVVALDLARWTDGDQPAGMREYMIAHGLDGETGVGFRVAHEALDSKVKRITTNVADLDADTAGTFDMVHVGDLLLHVRDPLLALQRVRAVTSDWALVVDSVNRALPGPAGRHVTEYRGGWPWREYHYWLPTLDTLAQMVLDAGFADVEVQAVFRLDLRQTRGAWRAALVARV